VFAAIGVTRALNKNERSDDAAPTGRSPVARSLQGGVDRTEFGVELRADALNRDNDCQRDTAGDEAIFDRGRAGLVAQKSQKQPSHSKLLSTLDGILPHQLAGEI
jgi:hypothetical protein